MKKILLFLFISGVILLYGQNNNETQSTIDSLKNRKELLNKELDNTKSVLFYINTIYLRWKANKNIDVFYFANSNCSLSDGSQEFYIDTNTIINIKSGTRVIVVKVTPNAYKIIYSGNLYFVNKKYLSPKKDYLKSEKAKSYYKTIDSLEYQKTELENKLKELNNKLTKRNNGINDIIPGKIYYLKRTIQAPRSYGKRNTIEIVKGSKVTVKGLDYKSFDSFKVLYNENKCLVRAGDLISEQQFLLNKKVENNTQNINSIDRQLLYIGTRLANIGIGDFYYLKKDCGARVNYQVTSEDDNVLIIPAGTRVRVLSEPYGAYEIYFNDSIYFIKPGCLLPETEYIIKSIVQSTNILKNSLIEEIKDVETALASYDNGKVYYFNWDCSISKGSMGYYSGGGEADYVMDVPKGTKVIVLSSGYNSYEFVLNGERYWVNSRCLIPEKKYLSELHEKQELRIEDSLAYTNPIPHIFIKAGWLCDSLSDHMGNCTHKTINVSKGTKVFFVKKVNTGFPRCIVYYNNQLYYTSPAFLVSEKSILAKERKEKERVEYRQKQIQETQEYQKARYNRLEKIYGSEIATNIIDGRIWIGMTNEMAIESVGKPRKVNRTVTKFGVTEQWVYNSELYLYFTDGILTSWQD